MTETPPATATPIDIQGPWFDELDVGDRLDGASAITLTDGLAAAHQAILGDRLRLALDHPLSARVIGRDAPLAHPALVWDIAIGQSTGVTQRVIANLFYCGLSFARAPVLGDTISTTVEIAGLRQNRPREDRQATGMAALHVRTVDQHDRPVLDFWRCAMLPLRDPDGLTGRADDLDAIPAGLDLTRVDSAVTGWDLDAFRAASPGPHPQPPAVGTRWRIASGDVVSCAPELARLSLNVAGAHHDPEGAGRRLVYGGHVIGLAAAQAVRALPNLVTILAWHSCDHTGPVHEQDILVSDLSVERIAARSSGALLHLRSIVSARRDEGLAPVLDWQFVALTA